MRSTSLQRRGARGLLSWPLLVLFLAALTIACGSDDAPTTSTSPTVAPVQGDIVVYAASSLTDAFKEAGAAFEAKNPGTKVTFQFAASSALATQINEGAPADVFASADTATMKVVADKGSTNGPRNFASNSPVVVVPKNSKTIATFADLAKPGIRLVLAGPGVPIGRYAREIFMKASATGGISADFSAKVLANLKSDEANVRAVLTKVQLGEADAGIVYVTDIGAASSEVRQVEVPVQYNVVASYPVAVLKSSDQTAAATAFMEFVLSSEGQAILKKYGFAPPTP